MTAVTITVLQDDIDHGEKLAPNGCPIARAVRRELPETQAIAVFDEYMTWGSDGYTVRDIMLPDEARRFIRRFDQAAPVEPFKFEIVME